MRGGRLFLTTDAVGGVWRYTVELAHGLRARGWALTVATVGPAPSAQQRAEMPGGVDLMPTDLPLDWLATEPAEFDRADMTLSSMARGHDAALLHAPAYLGWWSVPAAVMAHSSLSTWWQAVRGGAPDGEYAWRAAAAAAGFRRAAAVAAPSAAFADAVRQTYRLQRVRPIRNGRRPMVLPDVVRRRGVLTAGRLWDDGKNAAVLDRAAARLSAPLRAAGAHISPSGMAAHLPHLDLLGGLDETALARQYARATVFASAALYEPFGLAVLEAAQAGMALVLSDIPTFRELWDGAAIFVPHDDPQAWIQALEQALDAPEPWAARARSRAARYTVSAMVDATTSLLAGIMDTVPA